MYPRGESRGAERLADAQAAVDAGETSSRLDYNVTDCIEYVAQPGDDGPVEGSEVAIVTGEHPGPHDVPNRYFRLALISCGELFVGDEFGSTYINRWNVIDLDVEKTRDGLVVFVTGRWRRLSGSALTEDDKRIDLYRVVLDCASGVQGTVLPQTEW